MQDAEKLGTRVVVGLSGERDTLLLSHREIISFKVVRVLDFIVYSRFVVATAAETLLLQL